MREKDLFLSRDLMDLENMEDCRYREVRDESVYCRWYREEIGSCPPRCPYFLKKICDKELKKVISKILGC